MGKIFIDERKTAAIRQDNRLKKLQKIHKDQEDDLQRFMQSSVDMYKNEEIEYQLAAKQECFVWVTSTSRKNPPHLRQL